MRRQYPVPHDNNPHRNNDVAGSGAGHEPEGEMDKYFQGGIFFADHYQWCGDMPALGMALQSGIWAIQYFSSQGR